MRDPIGRRFGCVRAADEEGSGLVRSYLIAHEEERRQVERLRDLVLMVVRSRPEVCVVRAEVVRG
jgi:hypothetical protein